MTKTDVLTEPMEDEDIIELTDEIESEDEEIIDLTDGMDPIPEEIPAPVALPSDQLTPVEPASAKTGMPMEGTSSGKPLSIEELTIDSIDEEVSVLDMDVPAAEPPAGAEALDIDLDLDRLLPETPSPTPPSVDASTTVAEPDQVPPPISLDAFLAEEPSDLSSEPLLAIGLPLSGEQPAEVGASGTSEEKQLVDVGLLPTEKEPSSDLADRISDEQIDRAIERVIREMFEERISAAIYEVVERVVQDEMDRLKRLLFEEK